MDFLGGLNIVLTILSAICTGVAIYTLVKSKSYYEKTRDIIRCKDTTTASSKCDNMKDIFCKLPKFANEKMIRGKNINKEVADCGESIKLSLYEIRKNIYEKGYSDVIVLMDSENKELMRYIDKLISGELVVDNKFVINDNFYMCQSKIDKIQELIKNRYDEVSERLK